MRAAPTLLDRLEARRFLSSTYAMTDLGALGDHEFEYSEGFGINNRGQVAGLSDTDEIVAFDDDGFPLYVNHAFRWSESRGMVDLTSPHQFSVGLNINDKGEVAGAAEIPGIPDPINGGNATPATIWEADGDLVNIGAPAGKINAAAWGINNSGAAVGWGFNTDPEVNTVTAPPMTTVPFVYDKQFGNRALPMPGFKNGFAGDINDAGVIAGNAADHVTIHPVAWLPGAHGSYSAIDLGFLPGFNRGDARAINNRGQLAGNLVNAVTANPDAFIWTPGARGRYIATDIGKPAGASGAVSRDINNRGDAVGIARFGNRSRAFLYDQDGMHILNNLIPPGSGWILSNARSINDKGQITCLAFNADGDFHALLLNPVENQGGSSSPTAPARTLQSSTLFSTQRVQSDELEQLLSETSGPKRSREESPPFRDWAA
jgi:probable HAF family extracellular repeat protein